MIVVRIAYSFALFWSLLPVLYGIFPATGFWDWRKKEKTFQNKQLVVRRLLYCAFQIKLQKENHPKKFFDIEKVVFDIEKLFFDIKNHFFDIEKLFFGTKKLFRGIFFSSLIWKAQ